MALPKKKISSTRRGNRRSHDRLKTVNLDTCPKCREPKKPHFACPKCGFYKDREVVSVKA